MRIRLERGAWRRPVRRSGKSIGYRARAPMRLWPGSPVPARRDLRRHRHELLGLLRGGRAGRAVPVRRRRRRDARRPARGARRSCWHGYAARRRARASATASGPRPVGRPTQGQRCNPAKLLLDPYAKAIDGEVRVGRGGASPTASTTPTARRTTPTARRSCRVGRRQPVLRLGRRPPAAHAVARDGRSTRPTSRASPQRHPDVPEELRGTYAGLAHPAGDRPPARARRHRGRAAAGAPVRPRPPPARARACATTGATTRSASSRRTTTTPPAASAGQQVQEFKQMVKALHAAGHRGDPRRRLQPHRRGQPPRARRCRSRASTTPPTTGSSPTTRATTSTTPAPATASTCATRTCCS